MDGMKDGVSTDNLTYLEDTVLIAENEEDRSHFLNVVKNNNRKREMRLKRKKTVVKKQH